MVVVPPLTPYTTPLVASTVATLVLELVQTPEGVALLSVVLPEKHIVVVPVIDAGVLGVVIILTGIVEYDEPQVFVTVYVIFALPTDNPVTIPLPSTVAVAASDVLHVPPPRAFDSVLLLPLHIVVVPVIDGTLGTVITEITAVVLVLPQELVTVYDMVEEPTLTE